MWQTIRELFGFEDRYGKESRDLPDEFDWVKSFPFLLVHLICLLVFIVGFSWVAFITAAVLFFIREFSLTAFYHRYFSHQTFKTNRCWQFIFAAIGCAALQRGPIWWAAHHRHHHLVSDTPEDVHSPKQHGFLWSHVGWIFSRKNSSYDSALVKDLEQYPELVFLDRYDSLPPFILASFLFIFGWLLQLYAPQLNTSPAQMLIWGCISTVILYHCTFFINSLCHVWGSRRFATNDTTKNNLFLALLTLGEGWHNNHHHYPAATRQGFMWWEIDITYYVIKLLSLLGIVWDIRPVPAYVLTKRLIKKEDI